MPAMSGLSVGIANKRNNREQAARFQIITYEGALLVFWLDPFWARAKYSDARDQCDARINCHSIITRTVIFGHSRPDCDSS